MKHHTLHHSTAVASQFRELSYMDRTAFNHTMACRI